MAVLDVAIPTGYWIQQQKLDSYILSRRVRNLQRARYQERKVLFYFDYVSDFVFWNIFLEYIFKYNLFSICSLIMKIFVLILQLNDGIQWQICHVIYQLEFMIIMLPVSIL